MLWTKDGHSNGCRRNIGGTQFRGLLFFKQLVETTFLDHNIIVGKRGGRDKDMRGYVLIGLSDDIVRTLHIPCPIFVLGSCIINPRRVCAAKGYSS